jgi:hypothetical protein
MEISPMPNETTAIADCIDKLTAWNEGDEGVAETYTPDSLGFQQDLRRVLELAFIYIPRDAP